MYHKLFLYIFLPLLFCNIQDVESQNNSSLNDLRAKCYDSFEHLEMNDAILYGEEALSLFNNQNDNKSLSYFTILYTVLHAYFYEHKFQEVYEKGQILDKYRSVIPEEYSDYYISCLYIYNYSCDYLLKKREAEKTKKILNLYQSKTEPILNIARIFAMIGYRCYQNKEITKAQHYYETSLNILEKEQINEHNDYLSILVTLSDIYINSGRSDKAIDLDLKAISKYRNRESIEHEGYLKALNDLVSCYIQLSQFEKAEPFFEEIKSLTEKYYNSDSKEYAIYLYNYSSYLLNVSKKEDALKAIQQSIKILEQNNYLRQDQIFAYLQEINCYLSLSEFESADRLIGLVKSRLINSHNDKSMEFAMVCKLQAESLLHKGEDVKALKIMEDEALPILQQNIISPLYININICLIKCYNALGQYDKSISLTEEMINKHKSAYGTNDSEYAMLLNLNSSNYAKKGNYNSAIKYIKESINIYQNINGKNNYEYLYSLSYLTLYYLNNDQVDLAIEYLDEMIKINSNISQKNYSKESYICGIIATSFAKMKLFDKAIEYKEKELEIEKNEFDESHIKYVGNLGLLAYYYGGNENQKKATETYAKYFNGISSIINDNLNSLKKTERKDYWNKFSYIYKVVFPQYCLNHREDKLALSVLYNTSLLSKGILLNKEINDNNNLNGNILEKKSEIIKWNEIESVLNDSSISIEFQEILLNDDDSKYCALVLKKGFESPKLIPLFTNKEYEEIPRDSIYNSRTLYNLIWKPLANELVNVKDIYFAPDGIIHNIAIESAYIDENSYMSDQYNIYRLSSTREIVKKISNNKINKVVLYGGLKYDSNPEELNQANKENLFLQTNIDYFAERSFVEEREGINYLEGSKKEVLDIAKIIHDENITKLYTDQYGTEESFKNLTNSEVNILHISTHGYYYSDNHAFSQLYQNSFDEDASIEDKALTRSGLFFAGANNFLTYKSVPINMEDGILSAYEISKLNLKNLDLVVLSACQTGLGEIMGDGVFGLQRGFKIAGAKSLIMSLWKVNDISSQMMMTEFYRNYCLGMTKHQALLKAQKYIREFSDEDGNKIFKDPYYWAGFVLLDANK